jgi:hypothetical protein
MPPYSHYGLIVTGVVYNESSSHSTVSANATVRKPLSPAANRTVTFSEEVCIRRTINNEDYTREEKLATWSTVQEVDEMKAERRSTIKIMERRNPSVDGGQHCFRGLEFRTREGWRRRQFNQVDAATAIMDEQEAQLQSEINDPEKLAHVYIICSSHCQDNAHERALNDQRAALESVSVASPTLYQKPRRRLSCHAA